MSSRYRIGLVGDLDHLRRPLEASGFTPYGGPLDHHVTTQIETLLRQGPRTPVLVAPDHGDPSWVDWLETLLDADRRVVVLGDLPSRVAATRVRQVALDASLADALRACGATPAMVPSTLAAVPLVAPTPGALPAEGGIPDGPGTMAWPETDGADAPGGLGPVADVFDAGPTRRRGQALAEVIVVFGGRGGLGKTTVAAALAATAADRGLRVVLVDANVEQGDQHLLLRLDPDRPFPSVFDAARTGEPADAIAAPNLLNELRGARRDRVRFALAAAPPDSIPGAVAATTPAVYRSVIGFAASRADLVVVDTHPISVGRPSDLATDLILPLLRGDAWGLGLTDSSIPGLHHLERVLSYLIQHGGSPDRLMTMVNRMPASSSIDLDRLGARLGRSSHFIGVVVADDDDVSGRCNAGIQLDGVHVLAHHIEQVLARTCDLAVLTAPPGLRRRGRIFRWGRKAA